jgi:hypothetical protein
MVIAKVHIPEGPDFDSEIADLSSSSVFLKTDRTLPYRATIHLELFGLQLKGEVVYVSENEPKGIGVAIEASTSDMSRLKEEGEKLTAASKPPPEPEPISRPPTPVSSLPQNVFAQALRRGQEGRPATPPGNKIPHSAFAQALLQGTQKPMASASSILTSLPFAEMSEGMQALVAQMETSMGLNPAKSAALQLDPDGRLHLEKEIEAAGVILSLVSGRPIFVRAPTQRDEVKVVYREIEILCAVENLDEDGALFCCADDEALRKACVALNKSLSDALQDHIDSEYEPTVADVPSLSLASGVVSFHSFKHFVVQYVANISQGAIVVAGPELTPGTRKSLELFIPGIEERVKLMGRASFHGNGNIGFMLEDIGLFQGQLAKIAAQPPPSKKAQEESSTKPSSSNKKVVEKVEHRGFLSATSSLKDVFHFEEMRPRTLKDCKGWLARILDFLFENRVHGVCKFTNDDRAIELWIHDGGVVFTAVTPNEEQDKLGRMLVLQKKTSRTSLAAGLQKSKDLSQPIGRTLVSMGEIDGPTLTSAVRYQAMKRIFEVRGWNKGKVEVGPWKDPAIRTGLVITSGKAIMVNIIREEIRRSTLADVEEFTQPYLDRVFLVDLQKQDIGLGLKKKERRFFEKAAGARVNLRDLPKATAFTVNEAHRYVLLGRALGLMTAGKSAQEKTEEEKASETLQLLKDKVNTLAEGDLFEVLSLHWSCVDREIEPAFRTKIRELRAFKDSQNLQLRIIANRGVEMIEAAYDTLSSPAKRKEYRDKTVSEDERKQAGANMLDQVQLLLVKDDVVQAQILLKTAQEISRTRRGERLYADIRDGSYKVDL